MFIDTDFIEEALAEIEATYHNALIEESLPDTALNKYVFYNEAYGIVKAQPLEDGPTQKAMEMRLANAILLLAQKVRLDIN